MTDETAIPEPPRARTREPWPTRKRDQAPKGLFRHASSTEKATVWAVRSSAHSAAATRRRSGRPRTRRHASTTPERTGLRGARVVPKAGAA
jgi:hypothetical protein